MAEPPGFTFGDLFHKVAAFERWRASFNGRRLYPHQAQQFRDFVYQHSRELFLFPGVRELLEELPIDERYINSTTLAKVRDRLTGGDPWDHSITTLTIPEVVARLRQGPANRTEDEYRPWSWFASETQLSNNTMSDATKPDRKKKRVRFKVAEDGQKLYSVEDARTHWPELMTPKKK